ncbi:hypothetical protein J4Q44_G00376810 [Coregonus suidteri]|uniref:Uncharacterized protein n=1 Tax=Coregonus suidteri TaxID=861788 RepID=A0AAN8KSL2_9TELE
MVGFLYVLLSLTALQVECFSGGGSSIATQCGSMVPDNIHGNTGQSSPSPYTVTVSQTNYQPGDTIQVTLSGISLPFSGFLLEAHEEGKNTAVGTFSLDSGSGIVLVSCNGIAASGVSQSNNQPKRTVTVTWTAPASVSLGNIVVNSAQSYTDCEAKPCIHWRDSYSDVFRDTLTISSVAESDQGQYWCQGENRSRSISSIISDPVTITVNALPTASVKIVTPQGLLYPGDTVTLQCDISDYTDWTYRWFRDNQELPIQNRNTITSHSLTRLVSTSVLGGGAVGPRIHMAAQISTSSSLAGQYKCVGRRRGRPQKSYLSSALPIIITALPKATLTVKPNPAYPGETVTLTCSVGSDSSWSYQWFKDRNDNVVSQSVRHTVTGDTLTISRAGVSDQGQYWCEGNRVSRPTSSLPSDPVTLTVKDQPKAVLSIYPQWLNPGDSVSLSCEVDKTSTGWRFSWYRTVPTLTEQSYSFQRLPEAGNGTTEDSYTLIPAGPTPTGGYVCRAGRGDPVYDTLYSEPQFLWSGDLQPSVSLRISPNTTQHFTSKSLSLSCEEKGNSTGWRLMSYRERGVRSGCVSNWGSITGSTCTINYTYTWSSGVFWCESGSGEYSNAVNITVNDGDVILESPVHPVTEGDSVTLSCKYRKVSSNFKADFYKDGVLIKNETTGEMTIPTVSKSDEGFYKCKSGQGESPESWVTVRVSPVVAPGSSTSVLVGVVVGLVVAGVLLVILLVLLWRNQNNKGSCFIRIFWPPQPQSTNQDPQQDQGSTQARLLILDAAGASAAGPSHVTYAQIQLNKLDKKKKVKRDYPKENPVYSEVKTGKATAAAGPVDVTYAEVDLQKKVKAKKKRAAAGPVDVTYAEVDLQKKVKAKKKREPISKVAIQKKMKLLANQSCSVWLLCNVSVCSNLSYTWERGNETYRDDQQIHFSLSPADGDISVTCNASDSVSWKSASTTVKCSNDTTTPEYDTWLAWNRIYIGVPVGGAVVLILTVAVAVYYCRGRCNTGPLSPRAPTRTPNRTKDLPRARAPDTGYTHQQHGDANIYDTINPSDNTDNGSVM